MKLPLKPCACIAGTMRVGALLYRTQSKSGALSNFYIASTNVNLVNDYSTAYFCHSDSPSKTLAFQASQISKSLKHVLTITYCTILRLVRRN